MREGLRDYARMAWRHKPVRYSYLMLGAIGVAESARQVFDLDCDWKTGMPIFEIVYGALAVGTLAFLRGGIGTFRKYRKTRDQLREEGEISESLILHYHMKSVYCGRVGIDLAAEDCGYDGIPEPTDEMVQRRMTGLFDEVFGTLQERLQNLTMEDLEGSGIPEDEREEAYRVLRSVGDIDVTVGEPITLGSPEELIDYLAQQEGFESSEDAIQHVESGLTSRYEEEIPGVVNLGEGVDLLTGKDQ